MLKMPPRNVQLPLSPLILEYNDVEMTNNGTNENPIETTSELIRTCASKNLRVTLTQKT